MAVTFNRPRLQDFLTFYFEDWPNIEAAQLKRRDEAKSNKIEKITQGAQED